MTYCIALKVHQGLVFLSDTRTNAGVDNIAKVKKLFTWQLGGDRAIAMMTAGNLGITQAVISELDEQLARQKDGDMTLASATSMFYVAQMVGDIMRDVQARYGPGLAARGADSSASIILGGQRVGGRPRLFLIYSEGNFIEAMDDTPYFQIGEFKYGKPIIDRVVGMETSLEDATIGALLSMDSTLRSNLSVGMPLDLAILPNDSFQFSDNRRIDDDNDAFRTFSDTWSGQLKEAFAVMRTVDV